MELLPCKCGGQAKYICEWGMDDQIVCDSCDYKTPAYFDGYEYAFDDWNRRQANRPSALQEMVRKDMKSVTEYLNSRRKSNG